jgi:hypothetical protein
MACILYNQKKGKGVDDTDDGGKGVDDHSIDEDEGGEGNDAQFNLVDAQFGYEGGNSAPGSTHTLHTMQC